MMMIMNGYFIDSFSTVGKLLWAVYTTCSYTSVWSSIILFGNQFNTALSNHNLTVLPALNQT